jgi:hypothetical protein
VSIYDESEDGVARGGSVDPEEDREDAGEIASARELNLQNSGSELPTFELLQRAYQHGGVLVLHKSLHTRAEFLGAERLVALGGLARLKSSASASEFELTLIGRNVLVES